jgi:hypothetical protein
MSLSSSSLRLRTSGQPLSPSSVGFCSLGPLWLGAEGIAVKRLDRSQITQETFPLSSDLAIKLSNISTNVHRGKGVSVLRGLEAARFNDEEAIIAFAGVCSYVAPQRATDAYANQTLSMGTQMSNDSRD